MKHTKAHRSAWIVVLAIPLMATEGDCTGADPSFDLATIEQALGAIADDLGLAEDGDIGALDDSDEPPAFGDAVFARTFTDLGEREIDDEARDRPSGEEVVVYNILAVWGRIRPADNRPIGVVWNPALSVMEGDGVRVRRELRFERGDRVHPQRVRHEVLMSSVTGPHVDGVVAQVAITAADADSAFLRFDSLPISLEVPVHDLAVLNQMHIIDETGNGLMLVAVQRPPDDCPSGFMGGRWARTGNQGGVYGGVWRQANGRRTGYLAGRWGVTASGEQRFHGKVINNEGQFLAFMSGIYGEGAYEGEIHGRGGNLLGYVRGHYAEADGGGHGLFRGAWNQVCQSDTRDIRDGIDIGEDEKP